MINNEQIAYLSSEIGRLCPQDKHTRITYH